MTLLSYMAAFGICWNEFLKACHHLSALLAFKTGRCKYVFCVLISSFISFQLDRNFQTLSFTYVGFEGYAKIPYRYCTLSHEMLTKRGYRITTLSDAARECSDDPNCHMFYDSKGHGNSFRACGKTASIEKSSSSILYHP